MNVAHSAEMRVVCADERRMSLHKVHFNRFANFLQSTTLQ